MEKSLSFNPQTSTYIAHKTTNKYEQPKFITEQFKRLVNPNDKSLLKDLNQAHYSKNSMIVQMLKKYQNENNNLALKMKLGLVSLDSIKRIVMSQILNTKKLDELIKIASKENVLKYSKENAKIFRKRNKMPFKPLLNEEGVKKIREEIAVLQEDINKANSENKVRSA
jgi:hypothetical protein